MTVPLCPTCGGTLVCPKCDRENETFEKAYLIIGEGNADAAFFGNLAKARGLLKFQVARPASGKPGFERRLDAIKANRARTRMSTILLVRDNDGDAAQAFKDVALQVQRVGDYGVPTERLKPGPKVAGYPSIAVLTLPRKDQKGCLETLLWEVLAEAYPDVVPKVETLLADVPTAACEDSKRAKARVACMIASVCTDDPSCAVSYMWHSDRGFLPLLASPILDPLVNYLKWLCGDGPVTSI